MRGERWSKVKGWRSDNLVRNLEREEKPTLESRQTRILEEDEIRTVLDTAPPKYAPVIRTAVFTGLRLGELLALRWSDVDLAAGVIRVRRQMTKQEAIAEPKTASGKRDVVMFPDLGRFLREHRLASPFSSDEDFVFTTGKGTPYSHANVMNRGLKKAAVSLNRPGEPAIVMHDLRHTFASMLIRERADVVFVSRQLGHANPAITLRVYAHLFDAEAQATRMREALEARFGGNAVVTRDGKIQEETGTAGAENVVSMRPQRSR